MCRVLLKVLRKSKHPVTQPSQRRLHALRKNEPPMYKNDSSFQDLEKQLAKDALEKALKDLHGEITKDIDKNKAAFSQEIQKTLNNFKTDLEKTISKEL